MRLDEEAANANVVNPAEEEEDVVHVEDNDDSPSPSPWACRYQSSLSACLAEGGASLINSSIDLLSEANRLAPCMLGIDEAGRGPVLGPMLYACAVAPLGKNPALKEMGLADSKQLTEGKREELLKQMLNEGDWIAYTIHAISPMEITEKMLSSQKISLNVISQNAAIGLIRSAINQGVNLKEVYVDTVGKAGVYQAYLSSIFPELKIVVESKADATYPIVSAASIYAKVTRDRLLSRWPKEGRGPVSPGTPIGSGYPGDPATKQYLQICMDPILGFPPLVRSSWATAQTLLGERGVRVVWEDEMEAKEEATKCRGRKRQSDGSAKISHSFKATVSPFHTVHHRQPFFVAAGLSPVERL
ncbi:Ribonuclease H2 subunit A [Echinococcus granulosus]|nr:Ribonuclease H2 subunit A [Echinococcus granulosus]